MINVVELYGAWEGRIGRLVHALAIGGILLVALLLKKLISAVLADPFNANQMVSLILLYPSWVLSVKRAHDLGKSGLWVCGWYAAVIVGAVMLGAALLVPGVAVVGGLLIIAAFWNLIVKLFLHQGHVGANQFGPPCRISAHWFNDGTDDEQTARPIEPPAPRAPRGPAKHVGDKPAGFGRRTTA
jgi:uncharacterized membrane protein YhaH (DUF805 family)